MQETGNYLITRQNKTDGIINSILYMKQFSMYSDESVDLSLDLHTSLLEMKLSGYVLSTMTPYTYKLMYINILCTHQNSE